MNNKGFMMAEVVVVSAVILVTLTGLYVSYGKILSQYNRIINYYDVRTLYELQEINKSTTNIWSKTSRTLIHNSGNNKAYILDQGDIHNLKNDVDNQTFKDYIAYLEDSIVLEDEHSRILVMERCITTDNCKYAYLEVFT